MHLNTDPPQARALPNMRDMHELVTQHLRPDVVKLVPLAELTRRAAELEAEHPRFREELPLVLAYEHRRRARYQGLEVAGRPVRQYVHASEAYFHA